MDDLEVDAILADPSKRIVGDIGWIEPTPGSSWVKFSAEVESTEGWPLRVSGSYGRENQKISLCLLHPGVKSRLYSLEIGSAHAFPDQRKLEGTHKHRWNEEMGDANVYVPDDITANVGEPLKAWREFCAEARITHDGELKPPPPFQDELSW